MLAFWTQPLWRAGHFEGEGKGGAAANAFVLSCVCSFGRLPFAVSNMSPYEAVSPPLNPPTERGRRSRLALVGGELGALE